MKFPQVTRITPERAQFVVQEISEASEPGLRFYILVIVSTMIAGFGLTMNSTAVIIGAMLVAPLMTPIFGMALALIRGDAHLLGKASQAEIAGVAAAVAMGFILGLVYPSLEPTPEMISRTQPQLFDLMVAIFSGFAGAYALVDEKISPALPGVAIATAIVPPLANTGLCFAVGAYAGGVGSFLLFFSNFLSILLVASMVFWFFGMTGQYHDLGKEVVIRRFSLPVLGFFIVAVVLSNTLYKISLDRHLKSTITEVLITSLAQLPNNNFVRMVYQHDDDKIHVLAHVDSASVISPTQVSRIQDNLAAQLQQPVELIVQSNVARTVGALDALNQVNAMNLDGDFINKDVHPRVIKSKQADTIIRNFIAERPGITLLQTQLLEKDKRDILLATITGLIYPSAEAVKEVESVLREKLEEPNLELIVRFQKYELLNRQGRHRGELTGFIELTEDQQADIEKIAEALDNWFAQQADYSFTGTDYTMIDEEFYFYLDVAGPHFFPIEKVQELQTAARQKSGQKVNVFVISSGETVATTEGYQPYEIFTHHILDKLAPSLKQELRKLIEQSHL
ncbi:MAG: DUF389 domain-containing protein [Desulfofustis sp.]|jgi:uncharacterized hydrophobic protein (TIGR00271 family)